MNNIKGALTRKLGPLPFWIWAIIGGAAIWYYRNKISGSTTATTQTGQVVDSTATPGTPVSIGPGEAVYDPATGQMIAAPNAPLPHDPPQPPVTIELPGGGEAVYDPNTGRLLGEPPTPTATPPANTSPKQRFGGHTGKIYGAHGGSGGFMFLGNGQYIGASGKKVSWKQAHLPQNPVKTSHAPTRPRSNAHNGPARSQARQPAQRPYTRPRPAPKSPPRRRQPTRTPPRPVVRAHPAPPRRHR